MKSRSSHWRASSSPLRQAGTQIQEKQLVIALRLSLDEEAPEFLLHRFLQRGPADGVEAARHGVGEHLAELFRADEPPSRFHPGIELLEVLLGQLVQRDLPQLREDVLIDLRFVVHLDVYKRQVLMRLSYVQTKALLSNGRLNSKWAIIR